jgi:MFS family permease
MSEATTGTGEPDVGVAGRDSRPPTLMHGGFVAWLLAAVVSATGDGILYFALAWTASGYGALTVTLVLAASLLPPLLLTLFGGAAADRWGLRRTLIGCALAMCGLLTAYLLTAQIVPPGGLLLAALGLAAGVVSAFQRPASNAFPRLFFPDSTVPRAMSLTGSAMEIARIAGPPLGAILVAAMSMSGAVLADLASFAAILAVLVVVRPPYEPIRTPGPAGSPVEELRAGLRAVRKVPGVAAMLAAVGIVAGSVIPMLALCVPLLARSRGWTARDAGLMEAFWIVGALGISLLVAKIGVRARPVGPLVAGPVLASAGIVVAVAAPVPAVALAGTWLMGIGTAVFTSHLFPLYLLQTPEGMLARFQSVIIVAQMLVMFVGDIWLGWLAHHCGAGSAMLAAAGLCALAGVPVLASRTLRNALS